MVGEAFLPSNAYYPRTPDYTFYSGVHACWSEHFDSSFVYGFMRLIYASMRSLSLFQPTASKNIVFVCKTHYINCLMEELGMSTMTGNPTYNLTAMSKDEILQNHHSLMLTFGISFPEEDIDLPKLYWIPKLHKNPY